MIQTIVEKIKGVLLNPVETFRNSRADEPGAVFSYLAAVLLVDAVLMAIVAFAVGMIPGIPRMDPGVPLPVIVFFGVLICGFIITLVFAAWVHLWVYLFGGRKGIMKTITAIVYGHTPQFLLGWIPLISFIFMLWSFVLDILGIRELQELSTNKAILVMVIAVLIPLILMILALAYFMVSSVTMTPVPTNYYN